MYRSCLLNVLAGECPNLTYVLLLFAGCSVYSHGATWYPDACKIVGLKHYLHSSVERD